MAVLGILSIIQMIFLPGLIFSRLIKIGIDGLPKLFFIFGLSLFTNYLLVLLLTLCHLYNYVSILIIIVLEFIVCFWLFRKSLLSSFEDFASRFEIRLRSINWTALHKSSTSTFLSLITNILFVVLLIFAITDIVWMFQRFTNNIGTVFQTWDAVVSWNQWAVEWSKGVFPTSTSYYPQLIPANWSISYVLMKGIELQSFPKSIMPLFSLMILLMLFDLGIKTKSFGFFIGVILTRLMIKKFTGEFIADGYVDLPMSFFSFASVYFLLCARLKEVNKKIDLGFVFASIIMAVGAALTKQAGIFIFVLLPLLGYLILFRQLPINLNKQEIVKIVGVYSLALLIMSSWYFIKWLQVRIGADFSNIAYVTNDIYQGAGYIERALDAFLLLGKYKYLLIVLVPGVIIVKKPYQWLGVIIAIPFSLIWIFFFSYEARNLALIFPFWGLTLGLFVQQLFDYSIKLLNKVKIQKLPATSILFLLILVLGVIGYKFPLEKLTYNQEEKQWQLFNPELNRDIRQLVEKTGSEIKILTNYPVDYLPGLEGSKVSYWYDNLPDYLSSIANPEIDYLLVPNNAIPDIKTEIQKGLDNGDLQFLFSSDGAYSYQMVKVVH